MHDAVAAGAHGLELDVHYTDDDCLVVAHDDKLVHMTNAPGSIRKSSLATLLRLDAAYNWVPGKVWCADHKPGDTFPVGTIVNSNTVGAITVSTENGVVGGLVGANGGSISASSTAAVVSGGNGAWVGGLVGFNANPSSYPVFPALLSSHCNGRGRCGPPPWR